MVVRTARAFLHRLEDAAKRGVQIIRRLNSVREKGLIEFINPQSLTEMLTHKATRISTQYHQVRAGGDIAAILGLCKSVFAADDIAKESWKRVLDVSFIKQHTSGFETFEAMVRALDWSLIEQELGLTREAIRGGCAGLCRGRARNRLLRHGLDATGGMASKTSRCWST